MGLNYFNLDARVRQLMLQEIAADEAANIIYLSSYLSDTGRRDWPVLLNDAAKSGTDATFAVELKRNGRLNETAQRRKPTGGFTTYRVPVTANETLAEGEFNRFYIRGLCLRAIEDKLPYVEFYRAKEVENPRSESQAKLGMHVDPALVLADLRAHVGVETSSGFPGPNSGLSVKLP
jgi:hypothetical protein